MSSSRSQGQIQLSGQVLRSDFTYTWSHVLPPAPSNGYENEDYYYCCESPSFMMTDGLGIDHEWKVNIEFGQGKDLESGQLEDLCFLSFKYLGKIDRRNTVFTIRYRISGKDTEQSNEKIYCDIMTDDRYNKSRDFCVSQSYDLCTNLPRSVHSFKMFINISTSVTIFDMERDFYNPNRHDISLKNGYEELFESEQYSDVTFIVDKRELHLHKSVLSNQSIAFAAMFNHNFKENYSNVVHIDDQSYEVMKEFFRYLYAARVNELDKHAIELLITSNKYGIENLKSLCEQNLIKTLNIETVLDYLNLAKSYNVKNLEAESLKFIRSNAREIVQRNPPDVHNSSQEFRDEFSHLFPRKS
ncbi:hypothetical protein QAD02_004908 [Eretmocerus hayati]|uniref:Uncharacterized protein n=1 Tax=Eretmocerus hayati TaxID=131215 RepID=A0ACC2NSS6_9HYME|nr:hypothetical protein QAD02_004908 [Eretmocerus hayati]